MQKINVRNLLRMQKTGQTIRPLHIILGNRNLEKFGEIVNIPADSITYHPQFNAVDELSFNIYRERNGEIENLWNKIIDFKTVYVKEYNEWFEISVSTDESEINTKKVVTAKSLCEAELGQVILHDIEINTEDDIAREEYTEPTIFYNPSKKNCSLLNRILEKIPGYTIAHVDETLLNIQRSFSIDNTSVYDFLTSTLSQEIGCIFLFDSNTRSIYVYDMETCCLSCDYRSEDSFTVCPKCGGTILHEPYGKDTSIFIDKNNLGSDIQLTSETDNIKNCFRVIGGDDLINATLKNINPNGSDYIYYFNQDTLLDMPCELQDKIKSYDELVNEYTNNKSFSLESSLVSQYNNIIEYIKTYYPETTYSSIHAQYKGWSNITSVYYNIIDLYSYLNSSMMPTWKQQDKTAVSQLALLTPSNLSPVAVTDVSKISVYTANNAVLAMAKAIIDTSVYKVEILDGSTLKSQTWTGRFKLTSYSDKEDTAEMKTAISITINDDYIAYVNQQVDKAMGKVNDQGLQEIYKIESLDTFKIELHKYSAQRLTSYQSAYQTAINVLTEQGVASESSSLHNSIYLPYYERFITLESELSYRNSQLDTLTGLEKYIEDLISKTHNELDFESYIGEKYWKLFTYYRREDDYSNDNYISDGLTNTELIDKANELLVVAKKELVKSGEKQFTISGTLQNFLLLTNKDGNRVFESILDDFTLGNFIRTKIDGKIYVMRLADISISYGDLSKLSVTFSDAYRYGNSDVNIVKDILTKSQSMATSYSSTIKQASQGEKANLTFEKLQKNGLDSALYNVHNTNSTAIFDEHGILIRSYDDVLDDYKDEQARISSNEFVYTTDRWRTAETAIGKQKYILNGVTYEEYGVNSKFVISGKIIAGDIYSSNYTTNTNGICTSGTHFNLDSGDCAIGGDKLVYNSKKNKLSIKDVNIDWSSSSSPAISDIEDLDNRLNENTNAIRNNEKALTDYKAEVKLSNEEFSRNFTKMVTDEKERATTVETRISETAGKINWLIKDGTSESSMSLTSTAYDLIANNINLTGKVTFNSFDDSTKNQFNTISQDSSAAKNAADKALIAANNAIKSVDIEYYISTSPTQLIGGNWQTNAPKWSNNTYIWSRTKTLNENNQISYSNPACISGYTPVKGVDYFDGVSNYIWIRYATDSKGSNMTSTPSASTIYIGIATTTSSTAPTNALSYVWTRYVGENGIPGTPGADGKTTYIHIAYADSADGKSGFDTVNGTNKKYIGQYTDTTLADSSDPSKYTWSLIKGADGEDGLGITKLIEEYYLSTSSTSLTGGSWTTTSPKWKEGTYIWTRSHIYWEDDSETTTDPVLADALNNANSNATSANKTANGIKDNIYKPGTTLINGDKIFTGSITASKISIDDLSALNASIAQWNIVNNSINSITSDDKYWVGMTTPSKGSDWVYATLTNEGTSTSENWKEKWYVCANGFMYASNAYIAGTVSASEGSIGNWHISNGALVTYQANNNKGILMDQNYIRLYSWSDSEENFVGGLTTSIYTYNNEKRRSVDLYCDTGDVLTLCYYSDETYNAALRINNYMDGSIEFISPIHETINFSNGARIENPFEQDLRFFASGEDHYGISYGVSYDVNHDVIYGWHFSPKMNAMDLGTSSWKWGQIWAQTGEINTSDRTQKHNIRILDEDICVQITEKLKPSSYIMNNNTSGRTHYGFIAQDIEDMISELGIDSKEFAALIKSPKVKTVQDENGIEVCEEIPDEYVYSLRYTEFIPIAFRTLQYCIKEIKSLNKQIETLKDE
jgi:hypothetical protein